MASSLWTRTSRLCVHASPSAVVARSRHAFAVRNTTVPSIGPIRARLEHSLASKTRHDLGTGAPATPTDAPASHRNASTDLPEFASLRAAVSHQTLQAITVKPFRLTHMSAVQAEVLPLLPQIAEPYSAEPLADGARRPPRDLLVRAKTGTGKTLAFLVPAIEARIKAIEAHGTQAVRDAGLDTDAQLEARAKKAFAREHVGTLIISPTRELATQIANEALRLCQHHAGMEVRLFTGGVSKRMQMREWMRGRRDIVVATPGRMRDLLTSETEVVRGISKTKLLILDEADTLLDMGFRDDIEAIKEFLPATPERQTFLFSATVSRTIQQVARSTLDRNHIYINTVSEDSSPVHAHVNQYHTLLPSAGDQIPHTLRLLAHDQLTNPGRSKTIVFFPTTKMTQLFTTFLRELSRTTLPAGRNTKVYEIHSKKSQDARTAASDSFRKDKSGASILVTSDVSARGVDYPGVTRVIQVGIPAGTEQYVHRIGRTGRAGTEGRGDLVLLPWEIGFVTCQLTEVPLKPLTVNDLASQVQTLATQYDADPDAFFKDVPGVTGGAKYDLRGRAAASGPRMFSTPVSASIADINRSISELLSNIDETAIKETLTSLLGYYMAKSPEMRTHKGVIVQGCKDWSTQACGLTAPPYISDMLLQKLGLSEGRTRNFGRSSRDSRGSSAWEGRGRQRFGSRDTSRPAWASSDEAGEGAPGYRYGKAPRTEDEDDSAARFQRRDSSGEYGAGRGGRGSAPRESGYSRREGGFGQRDSGRGGYGDSGGFGRRESDSEYGSGGGGYGVGRTRVGYGGRR